MAGAMGKRVLPLPVPAPFHTAAATATGGLRSRRASSAR
jgi:hypothetical protein